MDFFDTFRRILNQIRLGSSEPTSVLPIVISMAAFVLSITQFIFNLVFHLHKNRKEIRDEARRQKIAYFKTLFLDPNLAKLSEFFNGVHEQIQKLSDVRPSMPTKRRINDHIWDRREGIKMNFVYLLRSFDEQLYSNVNSLIDELLDEISLILGDAKPTDTGAMIREKLATKLSDARIKIISLLNGYGESPADWYSLSSLRSKFLNS